MSKKNVILVSVVVSLLCYVQLITDIDDTLPGNYRALPLRYVLSINVSVRWKVKNEM